MQLLLAGALALVLAGCASLAPKSPTASVVVRPGLQQRQLTVMFAEVVGSTAMADGLAADDALTVPGSAVRRTADIVRSHQGREDARAVDAPASCCRGAGRVFDSGAMTSIWPGPSRARASAAGPGAR